MKNILVFVLVIIAKGVVGQTIGFPSEDTLHNRFYPQLLGIPCSMGLEIVLSEDVEVIATGPRAYKIRTTNPKVIQEILEYGESHFLETPERLKVVNYNNQQVENATLYRFQNRVYLVVFVPVGEPTYLEGAVKISERKAENDK